MPQPLIPADLLGKSEKILFIAHLALGDFTYLQNFFQAFAQAFPHLKVHLWVDEVRRTSNTQEWKYLKKYSLYDWVEECSFFEKIYKRTYSPELFRESIREAQMEAYPIVVSLATLRPHRYAGMARSIAPNAFVVGMCKPVKFFQPHHRLAYRKLDAAIPPYSVSKENPLHISGVYADWFRQLCGLEVAPAARFPFVATPEKWTKDAGRVLQEWGFDQSKAKLVFINPYAKTKKRSWPLEKVAELVKSMSSQDEWRNACFIVNAVPQELENAKSVLSQYSLERTQLFSAEENFFQLPAMLARCDLIISVETAVMHLANAVHTPVIALMRQKNPEWVPIDSDNSVVITTGKRNDWVKQISVEQVMQKVKMNAPLENGIASSPGIPGKSFHIAFCVDNNYFRAMGATITSIIENNPGIHFVFHVFAFEASTEHRGRLRDLEQRFNVLTQLHIIDPVIFENFSQFIKSSYYSLSIFSRLIIPSLLKGITDKVLYLDADILCVGKVDELMQIDMNNEIALVVPDAEITTKRRCAALKLKHGRYFNGGVLYMNVENWIANNVTEEAIQVLATQGQDLRFNDQDALNIVLDGKAKFIDAKWNYIYDLIRDLDMDKRDMRPVGDAVFLHFAGAVKPWATWTQHEARYLFARYHALSPWSDMPLDDVPKNTKELRMMSRFLLKRGEILNGARWYYKYLKARAK